MLFDTLDEKLDMKNHLCWLIFSCLVINDSLLGGILGFVQVYPFNAYQIYYFQLMQKSSFCQKADFASSKVSNMI